MNSRDKAVLSKILEEAAVVVELIAEFEHDTFLADERTKRAVSLTLINIGELVKLLSDDFRETNKSIPWRKIAGLRDVAAHGYFTLRMSDIWIYATTELPDYSKQIEALLNEYYAKHT
jgi:uncharacterized protein with HEPN domain